VGVGDAVTVNVLVPLAVTSVEVAFTCRVATAVAVREGCGLQVGVMVTVEVVEVVADPVGLGDPVGDHMVAWAVLVALGPRLVLAWPAWTTMARGHMFQVRPTCVVHTGTSSSAANMNRRTIHWRHQAAKGSKEQERQRKEPRQSAGNLNLNDKCNRSPACEAVIPGVSPQA
jgi:hypothetical protein